MAMLREIALPVQVRAWLQTRERLDLPDAVDTLSELAVDKTTAGETMHPYARVWVLRLLDGKKVWEGFADENGNWQADGLQPGFEYVAVGIDPKRVFKATAAGPVKAALEGDNG